MNSPGIEGPFKVGDPAPEPLPLRTESEILASWRDGSPVVSIVCPTYQHRRFVQDAIQGFLGQVTDFPFEIIIRDDASSDGTAEVVADFRDRYPGIIRAVLETENRYPSVKPIPVMFPMARGQYIAFCEGDDYWIDPRKIKVQVESLLARPDAVLSHHQALAIADGVITNLTTLPPAGCRDFSAMELRRAAWTLTNTMLHRNVELPVHPQMHRILNLDDFYRASLGAFGGAIYEKALLPSVYRRHEGGIWSLQDRKERAIRHAESRYWIGCYFADQGEMDTARHFLASSAGLIATSHIKEGIDARPDVFPQSLGSMIRSTIRRAVRPLYDLVASFARKARRR